jgi:glucokinase
MAVVACDAGATRIKFGVVENGRVLAHDSIPSYSEHGLAPRLPDLANALRRICDTAGISLAACQGISMSVPSIVDVATGRILAEYGRFRDMPGLDLRAWAVAEFGKPIALENDARMAAIGEWRYGAGRGCDNMVMITLGTGLGTSVIMEGRVIRGKHGQAGCLGGHLTLRYGGHPCGCGNIGCAESEASTKVLEELAHSHPAFAGSALAAEPLLDFAAVFRLAAAGDACSLSVRDHSLLVWSSLAVSLVHAYDPEMIVLGGGIMASADVILPAVRAHVHRYAHTPWGKVNVIRTVLGDTAALVAGEWLLQEQFPTTG